MWWFQKQENKHNKYLDQTCTITYVCVCQCVVGFVVIIIYHQFVPTRRWQQKLSSHNVVSSPPDNTHLLYHIPVLEAVFHESTIKRVLVSTVCSPEMPVASVVCSLVCGEIEYDCVQLEADHDEARYEEDGVERETDVHGKVCSLQVHYSPGEVEAEQAVDSQHIEKDGERYSVFPPDTVVNPGTVMVEHLHTPVALSAVLGPHWPHGLTRVTEIVDRIVHVVVLSPCRRVSYLCGER
jgi:hypothetical protein